MVKSSALRPLRSEAIATSRLPSVGAEPKVAVGGLLWPAEADCTREKLTPAACAVCTADSSEKPVSGVKLGCGMVAKTVEASNTNSTTRVVLRIVRLATRLNIAKQN